MSEVVSIEHDGAVRAREALEQCIGEGGVAVFGADTLYGLACDPQRAEAIERIHSIKGRDDGKPSAVMYLSPLAMREMIGSVGPATRDAIAALLPGPITLVVDNPERRYPLACRSDPSRLGLRLIEGPLSGVMRPIFQTSANRSGEPAVSSFEALDPAIVEQADLAIDAGDLGGAPSTVVDLTAIEDGGEPVILREGAVSADQLERLLRG